jgi:colanic acid biosynthesis glycosyl transferase WcaI
VEKFAYDHASRIVVICHGFRENLRAKGVPEGKLVTLPNWVDIDFIRPVEQPAAFRQVNGFSGSEFLVLHTGNMGAKQGLSNVLAAVSYLKHLPEVRIVLVGDGSEQEALKRQAAGLENVRILPLQPKEILPDMLSSAGVLVINQRAELVDMSLPSKLLTYMAAGRPVIAAVHENSEAARYLQEAGCGILVPPESPGKLAEWIERLYRSPQLAAQLGKNGRFYSEKYLKRDTILSSYADLIEAMGSRKGRVVDVLSQSRQKTA